LIVLILLQATDGWAGAPRVELLFTIARSTNANVVRYTANVTNAGTFDSAEPISAYWIMLAEDGHREELTSFEESHLYGFDVSRDSTGSALALSIKAMEKFPIRVFLSGGVALAGAEIAGHRAFLKEIFVQMGRGLFPSVDFIRLSGNQEESGQRIEGVIHP
jgi:hypothetical protein